MGSKKGALSVTGEPAKALKMTKGTGHRMGWWRRMGVQRR